MIADVGSVPCLIEPWQHRVGRAGLIRHACHPLTNEGSFASRVSSIVGNARAMYDGSMQFLPGSYALFNTSLGFTRPFTVAFCYVGQGQYSERAPNTSCGLNVTATTTITFTHFGIADWSTGLTVDSSHINHVAIVDTTGGIYCYVNGTLAASRAAMQYNTSTDVGIFHGYRASAAYPSIIPSGSHCRRMLDFRIYNRALSDAEVKSLSELRFEARIDPWPFRTYSIPASVGLYRRIGLDGGMRDLCAGLRG